MKFSVALFFLAFRCHFAITNSTTTTIDYIRYNHQLLNYTVLFCNKRVTLRSSEAGEVFKLFVDRDHWHNPCLVFIPSRVFVYLFIKFHKSSIVTLASGNTDFSHTGQTIIPKLNEATIFGPVYVPCEKSVIVFRSRGFGESLSFSFSFPSEKFLEDNPDPLTCDKQYQNPQLRRAIGYANASWLSDRETNIHSMRATLQKAWENHKKTAFEPLLI